MMERQQHGDKHNFYGKHFPGFSMREFMDLFTNHQLVIVPRAGHFIYLEQPELYINTIKEFLAR